MNDLAPRVSENYDGSVSINRDGVRYAAQMLPQRYPMPALSTAQANLLALYNLRVTGMREVTTGAAGQTDWTVYVRDIGDPLRGRDKIMLLHDSIEIWLAEIKEWLNPHLEEPLTATKIAQAIRALNDQPVPIFNRHAIQWSMEPEAKDLGVDPAKLFQGWSVQ